MDPFKALSLALDAIKGAADVLDKAKIEQAVGDMRAALIAAQQDSLELQKSEAVSVKAIAALEKKVRDLEGELSKAKRWDDLSACYVLKETRPASAIWIREYNEAEGRKRGFSEGHHWACANCFDQGKRSILTATHIGDVMLTCPICHRDVQHQEERYQGFNKIGTPRNY